MEKKEQVKRIFDAISFRYDLLNHLLSFGIDNYWRKKALKLSGLKETSRLLDVACGTGDFAITARKLGTSKIYGADLSLNMLKIFNSKMNWSRGRLVQSVAEALPYRDKSFTHITVAFGVRNFYDILEGFKSFFRVLDENGSVIVLEFSLPKNRLIKKIYLFYFNSLLPRIGRVISKDKEAYTYLPESVNYFDSNINLLDLFKQAGFTKVNKSSMTFGIVQIIHATK